MSPPPPPPPQFDDDEDEPLPPVEDDPYAATGPDLLAASWIPAEYLEKGINPLYTNGFFLLVLNYKIGIVHCTYLGVSGYNFRKILYSFV